MPKFKANNWVDFVDYWMYKWVTTCVNLSTNLPRRLVWLNKNSVQAGFIQQTMNKLNTNYSTYKYHLQHLSNHTYPHYPHPLLLRPLI